MTLSRPLTVRSPRRSPRWLLAVACIAAVAACRESTRWLGSTPAEAAAHADAILEALAARFGPLMDEAPLSGVRPKLVRSAFAPSRIFDDSSTWTASRGDERVLEIEGRAGPAAYLLRMRPGAPAPAQTADSRAVMRLRRLGESDYEWHTRHELAVGSVRVDDLGGALTDLFRAAESRTAPELRATYRVGLPRTTAALGALFTLDSLSVTPASGGGTLLAFGARMHPRRLAGAAPTYSRYLEKYVAPARYRLVLYDDMGARWVEAAGAANWHTLRVRLHEGSLAPLEGPPRRIPAALRARVDFSMKVLVFRVGVRGLVGDVSLTREPHEKAFAAHFRSEPDWSLPPLVGRMIRTPLRRPFEGEGALYAMAVRDSVGTPTVASRDLRLAVRESAIMRWIGGLGNTAVSDFRLGAEREAERFYRDVLEALRADLGGGAPD